jgi:hypothetical protein
MSDRCCIRLLFLCSLSLPWLINIVEAQDFTPPVAPSGVVVKNICSASKSLPILAERQATTAWCWAATATIVMHYLGEPHDQCFVVDAVRQNQLEIYHPSSCCIADAGTTYGCGDVLWYSYAALDEFSFSYNVLGDSTFSWSTLQEQICQDKAVIYGEDYTEGGGHEYVLYGFIDDQDNEEKTVILYDPSDNPADYREEPYDTWLRLQAEPDEIRSYVEFLVNIAK